MLPTSFRDDPALDAAAAPRDDAAAQADAALRLSAVAHDLLRLRQPSLAREVAELALRVDADQPNCRSVLAGILDMHGEHAAALFHWREAVRLAPDSAGHRVNLALGLLAQGDWDAGLPLYEARVDKPGWTSLALPSTWPAVRRRLARDKGDLAGRRVLVFTEQGLGDCLWAARWLPALARQAGAITLATGAALRPVLTPLAAAGQVLSPPPGQANAKINLERLGSAFDCCAPMMSLPWLLGVRPADAPATAFPYVRADPVRVAAWRERFRTALPAARRIVGLVWRASPGNASSPARTLGVASLASLAALGEVAFVNLQGGPPEHRAELPDVLPAAFDALRDSGGAPPLDEFAAAVAATDVLVSVDTMAAHMAGALGHPALIALPAAAHTNFYWGTHGPACPWYPSLQLFRQQAGEGWAGVVGAIAAALRG